MEGNRGEGRGRRQGGGSTETWSERPDKLGNIWASNTGCGSKTNAALGHIWTVAKKFLIETVMVFP